jgi:hypothetical protein
MDPHLIRLLYSAADPGCFFPDPDPQMEYRSDLDERRVNPNTEPFIKKIVLPIPKPNI